MVSTDEGTDLRQTAVPISKELGTIPSFSIHTHGAELIQRKRLTLIADTLLAVDDIPLRVLPLDEQGDQGDQGREENQRNQGQGKVEGSLDDAFESIHYSIYFEGFRSSA